MTGNGLPQPGYHLVLSPAVTEWINAKEGEDADAAAAAERLDQILTFTYDVGDVERTWKLDYLGIHSYNEDGSAAAYVYSMTEVNNNPVSLRVFEDKDNSKTLTDGDKTITTDDIPMSETAASAEYLMTIDGGPLDQSKVQGKFTIGEDSITCGVTIGYGTLTVKSTTNKEYVTEIGTVDDNQISATGEGVTYYVNNSEVEVASNRGACWWTACPTSLPLTRPWRTTLSARSLASPIPGPSPSIWIWWTRTTATPWSGPVAM